MMAATYLIQRGSGEETRGLEADVVNTTLSWRAAGTRKSDGVVVADGHRCVCTGTLSLPAWKVQLNAHTCRNTWTRAYKSAHRRRAAGVDLCHAAAASASSVAVKATAAGSVRSQHGTVDTGPYVGLPPSCARASTHLCLALKKTKRDLHVHV